ncbi:hypothetical protein CC86DRAFT_401289 [Ophiobolus disseminans]|uniref:Rhodopsin domain-containing protein n=1 Tax=Ophiobolus disseminans TaxID=1469910 RepID=A0A6A7AGW3_9PLEO|nr:hypothetical protein CC86DRAFT_401289 [Ophiobolus disseminans]
MASNASTIAMATSHSPGTAPIITSNPVISVTTFYVMNWLFFAICTVAITARLYIRYVCFRRLILEDYLMLFAWVLHSADAILVQLWVRYQYDLEAVGKGDLSKLTPNFMPNSKKGFAALGASVNLTMVGVLIVKLNFLIFFRRLGRNIHRFNIAWWAILVFTVGTTVAQIAMQNFGCFFGDVTYIFSAHCEDMAVLKHIMFNAIFSAVADALSDLFIIALPVTILWKSRINKRKKFVLTLVFGLVFFTISITIVRGSVFHDVYGNVSKSGGGRMQSGTFTWFWFYVEFSVAFIIACIVSFRTLFVQRKNESEDRDQVRQWREQLHGSAIRRDLRPKARKMYDSLLDTCKTLEGVSKNDDGRSMHGLPSVPTGLMTVNFEDDNNWAMTAISDDTNYSNVSEEQSVQVQAPPKVLHSTQVRSVAH